MYKSIRTINLTEKIDDDDNNKIRITPWQANFHRTGHTPV